MLLIYDHVRFPAVQQAQRGSAVIPLFRCPRDFTGVLSGDNNWKVESLNWFICSIDFWWVFVLFFFSLSLSFFLFVNIGNGKWNNVISRDMIYYISINIVWLIRVFDNPCNFLILGKFLLLLLKLKFNKECCCIISNLQVIEFNFSQKFRNETCLTNLDRDIWASLFAREGSIIDLFVNMQHTWKTETGILLFYKYGEFFFWLWVSHPSKVNTYGSHAYCL